MYKTISDLQIPEKSDFIIVGAGKSADYFKAVLEIYKKKNINPILIFINRAVCLYDKIDLVFVDGLHTLEVIKTYFKNTKNVAMPLFSNDRFNINSNLVNQNINKIVFYFWGYEDWNNIKSEHILHKNMLYLEWGNVQSIAHFCYKKKAESVFFVGCDGGFFDGKLASDEISKYFRQRTKTNRQQSNYQQSFAGLRKICSYLKLNHEFFKNLDMTENFINKLKNIKPEQKTVVKEPEKILNLSEYFQEII